MYEDSRGHAAPLLDDRYRLIAQLGSGGAARVLRAWDERLDREVAIKMFQPHTDPVGRRRFEDEAKLLAGFDHPGLVKVYDSGFANGEPYLVLQLINGSQLGRRIDQGPIPSTEVREIGICLAEALAYVHSRGVVHRDIKPGNVLLCTNGRPYLADFGLAKLLARTGLTAFDRLVGTAAYLSPEQVLGTEVGPPADVYGLGLVLVECLTGEVEYPGLDAETVLARVSRRPRVPDDVPDGLGAALEAMTRSDPAERPSAAECVELLAYDQPVGRNSRLREFVHGRAVVVFGAALVAAVLGLTLAVPVSDGTQLTPVRVQPGDGAVLDSSAASPVTLQSKSTAQQAPPAADPPPGATQRHTVVRTPEPTSTPLSVPSEESAAPLQQGTSAPGKTKKPKKTKTKTKDPKDRPNDKDPDS